ncbi:hypothetical protein FQN49_007792 [Arthroderma sp. PD_2]|nr:hypothetical protein FQN49_007792 [Arthroderma sp. PD_2]
MNSDWEREERSVTPVPGSSLDPDSPLEDSPIYPRSPGIDMATKEQEEPSAPSAPFDSFVTIPMASPTASPRVEPRVEPRVAPRTQPKKSTTPVPKPRIQENEFSSLARELEGCTWEQLQQRFTEEMDERSKAENILQKETADLLEVFMAWSQTTTFRDEDRAYKRFKTRMDHVQMSEANLEGKKAHYANVVKAFESALALLRTE